MPRLRVGGYISFLVDTGAAPTIIMPIDGGRLKIDYNQLRNTISTIGIGGFNTDFQEQGSLYFIDSSGNSLYAYDIILRIASVTSNNQKFPSVLGRNIIDNWRLVYDKRNDDLTADVWRADSVIPVAQPVGSGKAANTP